MLHGCYVAAIAAALLFGCSSVPRTGTMQVWDLRASSPHASRIGVNVEGGGSAEWRVHDTPFKTALVTSLTHAGVFSAVVDIEDADYRLDAVLGDLRQPGAERKSETVMTVLWSLSRVDTEQTVWQELIRSTGTSNHLSGALRRRGGAEQAARENIREALRRMAEAPL